MSTQSADKTDTMRISAVVDDTGVSKELIHYYIREGLIPKPEKRARYTEEQVRLLQQIKKLRDDHGLPLDVIRNIIEMFSSDPEKIEPLTLAESLGVRVGALVEGDPANLRSLTLDELATEAEVSVDKLDDYLSSKMVVPYVVSGEERFTPYDANIIRVCEQGMRHGIPFDTFRSIGTYSRVGFELEYGEFMRIDRPENGNGAASEYDSVEDVVRELFLRRELAIAFVQNHLQSLVQASLQSMLEMGRRTFANLDSIIYRPSDAFVRRHGLDRTIVRAREQVVAEPNERAGWAMLARTMLHAGKYREASFFLEEARRKWPLDRELHILSGRARLCVGEISEGLSELAPLTGGQSADPVALVYSALGLYVSGNTERKNGDPIRNAGRIVDYAKQALASADDLPPVESYKVRIFGGWLLAVVPEVVGKRQKGMELISAALEEIPGDDALQTHPGLRERYCINASFLLFESMSHKIAEIGGDESKLDELRAKICGLDPGCDFAQHVYLHGSE